jgi:hypothetical protein
VTITHTVTRTITLNGTVEYPTSIEPDEQSGRQGENLVADNGGLTVVVTGTKRRWVLTWGSPLPAVVNRVRALYALGSFTITDHLGAVYGVVVPIGGMRWKVAYESGNNTSAGATYPDLTLTIWEA